MIDVEDLILSAAELKKITGYTMASKVLAELHRQGFHRARINRLGVVVLERAHYDAVCAGVLSVTGRVEPEPKLASEMK
jgi:hypothetical protein